MGNISFWGAIGAYALVVLAFAGINLLINIFNNRIKLTFGVLGAHLLASLIATFTFLIVYSLIFWIHKGIAWWLGCIVATIVGSGILHGILSSQKDAFQFSQKDKRRHTLAKISLVVVWILILAIVIYVRENNPNDSVTSQIRSVQMAIVLFESENGRYPNHAEWLEAQNQEPPNLTGWVKETLTHGVPRDPWGEKLEYKSTTSNGITTFVVYSKGKDRIAETKDDIQSEITY